MTEMILTTTIALLLIIAISLFVASIREALNYRNPIKYVFGSILVFLILTFVIIVFKL
jgi:hypothetical protein